MLFCSTLNACNKTCTKQEFIDAVEGQAEGFNILKQCNETFSSKNEDSLGLFSWLIRIGEYELIKDIIKNEQFIYYLSKQEMSNFLFDALVADNFSYEIFMKLVEEGAEPNHSRLGTIGIVYAALERQESEVLKELKELTSTEVYFEPQNIFAAIKSNNFEYIEEFIKFNPKLEIRNEDGLTPIEYLDYFDVSEDIERLVRAGLER